MIIVIALLVYIAFGALINTFLLDFDFRCRFVVLGLLPFDRSLSIDS